MRVTEEIKPDESGKFSQEYVHSLREENKSQRLKAKEFEGKFKDAETKFKDAETKYKDAETKYKDIESKFKDIEAKFTALTNEPENKNKDTGDQNKFKELYETTKKDLEEQSKFKELYETTIKDLEDQNKYKELYEVTKKDLEEQNKFKELYETTRMENESLKAKADEVDNLNEKLSNIEIQRRNELLEQLTEAHREFAKDLPLDKLPAYVKLHKDTKLGVDGGRSGALNFVNDNKKWEDYSDEQLVKIEKENKSLYEQLLSEYKSRKRN